MSAELPCGERVVRCLLGQEIDRVPYGVGIGWSPWGETLERWRLESGDSGLDPSRLLRFDASFVTPAVRPGLWPPFEARVLEEDDRFVVHQDERGIVMRNRRDGHSMPEWLRHPVESADDWQRLKVERLRIGDPDRVCEDWDVFRARIRQTGEAVQVGWFPYGVFGTPRDLMGVERLLTSFYDDAPLVLDMMGHLTSLWIELWARVAQEVRIDHIHIWEDMSGRQGSLISTAMVSKFMMPCYDRIKEFADSVGARLVSVDTDGDCSQLVPVMMEHGINVFFPFEVQAGNDVLKYRRQYPELGILGGLDKRALAGTRAEIEREILRAERMVRLGRYVPGFDHLIPPDVPWLCYRYAARRLREVCDP